MSKTKITFDAPLLGIPGKVWVNKKLVGRYKDHSFPQYLRWGNDCVIKIELDLLSGRRREAIFCFTLKSGWPIEGQMLDFIKKCIRFLYFGGEITDEMRGVSPYMVREF
jgi:hypothetical protein